MATDYSILENELSEQITNLKRDLHMHNVKRLRRKQDNLAQSVIQRKQIKNLEKQVAELRPMVSTLYCPQFAVKDKEIRGYLVYLLKMKDFFAREVITKQEMINQKNNQIKEMNRKLCHLVNERAKIAKNRFVKSPEFVRLENASNRINQMNKRISTVRQENKEIMENIMKMRIFQKQFQTFEKDFRRKIEYLKLKAQGHLDSAVAAYEEKDSFQYKEKMFQERSAQDARKTAVNVNALNLCLGKAEKNEAFAKLQAIERTDPRIAETGGMISKGITGLEPNLETTLGLHSAISLASGEETPNKMEEKFKFADDKMNSMFLYLDELLTDIHHLENEITYVEKENEDLIKGLSSKDQKLHYTIEKNKGDAHKKLKEADDAAKLEEEAKDEMDSALETVKRLYTLVCPQDSLTLDGQPLDDSNVIEFLQQMEKQLLDLLICSEYIRMKEASKEEKPLILETEEDNEVDDIDESDKLEDDDKMQPRPLHSELDLQSLSDLDSEKSFLDFENLKEKASAAVTEMQLEEKKEEKSDIIE